MPTGLGVKDILDKMATDKKNKGGIKYIVLLRSIGDAGGGAEAVEDKLILRVLAPGVCVVPKR